MPRTGLTSSYSLSSRTVCASSSSSGEGLTTFYFALRDLKFYVCSTPLVGGSVVEMPQPPRTTAQASRSSGRQVPTTWPSFNVNSRSTAENASRPTLGYSTSGIETLPRLQMFSHASGAPQIVGSTYPPVFTLPRSHRTMKLLLMTARVHPIPYGHAQIMRYYHS